LPRPRDEADLAQDAVDHLADQEQMRRVLTKVTSAAADRAGRSHALCLGGFVSEGGGGRAGRPRTNRANSLASGTSPAAGGRREQPHASPAS
jgi:hypothetical protein